MGITLGPEAGATAGLVFRSAPLSPERKKAEATSLTEARVPTPSDMQRQVVRNILERGMKLLDTKGHDYAGDDSAFINFTFTGLALDYAVSRGLQGEDLSFLALIATKLARLIELRGSAKEPKNETIEDTCMDLANYAALWGGWILTRRKNVYELAAEADASLKAGEIPTPASQEKTCKQCRFWSGHDDGGVCTPHPLQLAGCEDFEPA